MATQVPYKIYKQQLSGGFKTPADSWNYQFLPDLEATNSTYTRSIMQDATDDEYRAWANRTPEARAELDSSFGKSTTAGINDFYKGIMSGGSSASLDSGYRLDPTTGHLTTQSSIDQSAALANDPNMRNIGTADKPMYVPKGSPGEAMYNANPGITDNVLNPAAYAAKNAALQQPGVPGAQGQQPTMPNGMPIQPPPGLTIQPPNPNAPPAAAPGAAPAMPNLSGLESDVAKYMKPGADEDATQAELDRLTHARDLGLEQNRTEAKALPFIQGEAFSRLKGANLAMEPLQQKLARLQAQRQASSDVSKFALERADKAAATAKEDTRYETAQAQQQQAIKQEQQATGLDLALKYGIKTNAVNIGGTFYRTSDMHGYPDMPSFLKDVGATDEADARKRGLLSDINTAPGATDLTTDMKEYQLAKTQGFGGSFLDWQTKNANLKNSTHVTTDSNLIKEYNFAVAQGFKGSLIEYQQASAKAKDTTPSLLEELDSWAK